MPLVAISDIESQSEQDVQLPQQSIRSQDGQSRQLASPPISPIVLPATSEADLRNGFKLDFVKEFRLGLTQESAVFSEDREQDEATETTGKSKEKSDTNVKESKIPDRVKNKPRKLSSKQLYELASSPESLPVEAPLKKLQEAFELSDGNSTDQRSRAKTTSVSQHDPIRAARDRRALSRPSGSVPGNIEDLTLGNDTLVSDSRRPSRPSISDRTSSTPLIRHRNNHRDANVRQASTSGRDLPSALRFDDSKYLHRGSAMEGAVPSPKPDFMPAPPLSMPTYLQLELSAERPSPLYIHRSITSDFPYESSRVKIERLKNFMLLPPQLEQVLWFGALACLDAWLYAFTILPLRFLKAVTILLHSWVRNIASETRLITRFIYKGSGRMWDRHRRGSLADAPTPNRGQESPVGESSMKPSLDKEDSQFPPEVRKPLHSRHLRTKSTPSALLPDHKADILRGLLILISCNILMYFDASKMYHGIRGQAAIKLYVIYNVLEVCDRLFSALGQDVLECLFSKEALERKADGRSKVLRPFWLFMLALVYNLVHSTALFYQVITLNVAVNSYSNALLTLLMSNQFVEIKSTVFKKFEKENLFQLTCADVVERFQLWLMLMIIASRNVVETGGLSFGFLLKGSSSETSPASHASILPRSFTLFPAWTGQVLAPFFLVLGSEMLVDWLKHAYISKFNNTKPAIYGRFLDVLAKDYYSNAFADQNLTRRLGLPVIPLSCLFIRASVQTYHMFLATYLPPPLPSTATSLSVDSTSTSAATTEALVQIDNVFRRALYGPAGLGVAASPYNVIDFFLPYLLPLTTLLLIFLLLLALKILLGMALLSFARSRYSGMKEREKLSIDAGGRRIGGWGTVEVDEDKRRWIYADDPDGVKRLRDREAKDRDHVKHGQAPDFSKVERYSMTAKRIW